METISINFNEPYEIVEIFRFQDHQPTGNKKLDEEGELVDETEAKMKEFQRKAYFCWENVREIGGYPYNDDWSIKGEKYFIKFNGNPNEMLILGNMAKTVALWKLFRNLYPMFPQPGNYTISYNKPIVVDDENDIAPREDGVG